MTMLEQKTSLLLAEMEWQDLQSLFRGQYSLVRMSSADLKGKLLRIVHASQTQDEVISRLQEDHAALAQELNVRLQELALLQRCLDDSVKLQSHYADLLNAHDGGARLQFTSETWCARVADIVEEETQQAALEQLKEEIGFTPVHAAVSADEEETHAVDG